MITMDVHVIVLYKDSTGEVAWYYNHVTDSWVKDFQLGCACKDKAEAVLVMDKLDIFGASILGGNYELGGNGMNKRIVSKRVIDVVSQLGSSSSYNSSKETLQDKAKNTLDGYKKGQWNSRYTTSIEKNMGDIQAIANGEKVRYKVAEIFRDGETDVMEIEEVTE